MNKNLVLLFEGMNYEYLMNLVESGLLPNFKKILEGGCIESLKCNPIPYEAAGITTAFSGMNIEEHGIISYWKVHNQEYEPKLWNSQHIKDKMLWSYDNLKKYKFNLINLFGTFPAYDINGSIISYAMEKTLHFTYPKDLLFNLSKRNAYFVQDTAVLFHPDITSKKFYEGVKKVEEIRFNTCKQLLKDDFDVMILNNTLIDRVSHFYTGELKDKNKAINDTIVFQAYKKCDDFLGELIDEVYRQNINLLFFSEMGFGHLEKFVEINKYLNEQNVLKFQNPSLNQVDWDKTIAFESVQGSHGININMKSRYKSGIISENEYNSVVSDIIEILKKMKNPYNDNPMFNSVKRKEQVFGDHPWLPDIILEPYDWKYLPYGDSYWANYVHRHCQTGWHRPESLWGGIGPDISGHKRSGSYELRDMAPTIFHLLGEVAPSTLKGKSLINSGR